MNRGRISISVFLCFLMMMFLLVIGCSKSDDAASDAASGENKSTPDLVVADTVAYAQADLAGTWKVHQLLASSNGNRGAWKYLTATIDSSGLLTFSSCVDAMGETNACPTGTIKFTMAANGVISETDDGVSKDHHYTMTSNKNFIAGTQGTIGSTEHHLVIIQKAVSGTVYSNADLQSKSFVIHGLSVGGGWDGWQYTAGTTNSSGLVTIISGLDSSGTSATPGVTEMTISVDASGVVTTSGNDRFRGFLSNDKKTIVGTDNSSGGEVSTLSIIQVTGQTYTAGSMPAGISAAHMLAVGASIAPFWVHFTATVASGGVTVSDWVSSNSGVTAPGTTNHGSIDASGKLTIDEIPTYHGQVSDDSKFIVATQTLDTGVYALSVMTK